MSTTPHGLDDRPQQQRDSMFAMTLLWIGPVLTFVVALFMVR